MASQISARLTATGLRVAIVVSRFNDAITSRLLSGARDVLVRHGAAESDLTEIWVPGAWELPVTAKTLAETRRFDAIVALGCVIRGQTTHHLHIGGEASRGLARLSYETGVAVGFGVLTCETMEQALDRAGGKAGNKGADAALGAIEMANLLREIRKPS